MCGITGYISTHSLDNAHICEQMTNVLSHRGPDNFGYWIDNQLGVVFGHRRLSIQDLSDKAKQPMKSNSERFIVSFNGEIYNFKNLRKELENRGVIFKTNSDTEVLIESIEHLGLENSLKIFSGMFAFSLWDKKEKKMILARDKFGEKPLYYSIQNNNFFFASELKSLKKHPLWKGIISKKSLSLYSALNYIPSPLSIYENTFKLLPGTYLIIDYKKISEPKTIKYWSSTDFFQKNKLKRSENILNDEKTIESFIKLFNSQIDEKLISDVPIGCFLSGGIDSSVVATLTQKSLQKKIDTFSVGFNSSHYDESKYSRSIAKIINSNHHELIVSDHDARNIIPKLPEIYDEPFADSSQIPMFLISNYASQEVKVALSGDGGDELFGGYNRYIYGESILNQVNRNPTFFNKIIIFIIYCLSENKWNTLSKLIGFFNRQLKQKTGEKLYKIAKYLSSKDKNSLYLKFISNDVLEESYLMPEYNHNILKELRDRLFIEDNNFIEGMVLSDLSLYLPDDILTKIDRAAMHNSLETRVPFLDQKIFEFAMSLPLHQKIRNGKGKWVLNKTLEKYLPLELINRPKMGFSIPINEWLRGPLRDVLGDLITKRKISNHGYFNYQSVQNKFQEHVKMKKNWHFELWNILVFQLWLEKNSI